MVKIIAHNDNMKDTLCLGGVGLIVYGLSMWSMPLAVVSLGAVMVGTALRLHFHGPTR